MEFIARYFVFLVEMCTLLNSLWRVNVAYFLGRFWEQKVKFKNIFFIYETYSTKSTVPTDLYG